MAGPDEPAPPAQPDVAGARADASGRVPASELRCQGCGAPWTLRGFATTRTAACEHCGSIFDTSGETWQLVQKVEGAYECKPLFPLGRRGELDGGTWEIIGWCRRSVTAYGQRYPWQEHLLYNPFDGFRYLVAQDGHFVLVEPLPGVPSTGFNRAVYEQETFKHFTTGEAVVEEVLGEFPWQVKRGDTATATDYVSPPWLLSSEETPEEVVWSRGRYVTPEEVVRAFGEPNVRLGSPRGVNPCQPNPHQAAAWWMAKALVVALAGWLVLSAFYWSSCDTTQLWDGTVADEVVSVPLTVTTSGTCALEVRGDAAVDNNWTYLAMALVRPEQEQARYLGLEIDYYHGVEGGESWSEGARQRSVVVGGVEPGAYVLQIERSPDALYKGPVHVSVHQDVPLFRYPCCSFPLLFVIPLLAFMRSGTFEGRRWSESDHAG